MLLFARRGLRPVWKLFNRDLAETLTDCCYEQIKHVYVYKVTQKTLTSANLYQKLTGHFGPRTLWTRDISDPGPKCLRTFRTQVRSIPRDFGPRTEMSGHFGPTFLGPKYLESEVSWVWCVWLATKISAYRWWCRKKCSRSTYVLMYYILWAGEWRGHRRDNRRCSPVTVHDNTSDADWQRVTL